MTQPVQPRSFQELPLEAAIPSPSASGALQAPEGEGAPLFSMGTPLPSNPCPQPFMPHSREEGSGRGGMGTALPVWSVTLPVFRV